jgi:hypothetical protein
MPVGTTDRAMRTTQKMIKRQDPNEPLRKENDESEEGGKGEGKR